MVLYILFFIFLDSKREDKRFWTEWQLDHINYITCCSDRWLDFQCKRTYYKYISRSMATKWSLILADWITYEARNTPRREKGFGQKRDAKNPLEDVLIQRYQYADHSRQAQPAAGTPHFARETVLCCPRRHLEWEGISVLTLKNSGTGRRRNFEKL